MKKLLLSLGLICSGFTFAHEHEKHKKEYRSAEVHTHGLTHIYIVAENDEIELELNSPAYNFLGFEYEPQTNGEKKQLQNLKKSLKKEQFFSLSPQAECELKEFEFNWDTRDKHAEIETLLDYKCKKIKALKEIQFDFSSFEYLEEIKVEYLNEKGEALSQNLTLQKNKFQLP